ncbi:MAG TPA: hypothetical protein VI341_04470 [Actinomycetota bacterium]
MIERPPLAMGQGVAELGRCAIRTVEMIARHHLHQPTRNVGRRVGWADGTASVVYRETVAEGPATATPTTLVVSFRLRRVRSAWLHALFRFESELNTVLFAGFPGFISKLWFANDERGVYRGLYDWRDPVSAEAYVRALWWAVLVVSERDSIHYAILPGVCRDEILGDPSLTDAFAPDEPAAWWRVASARPVIMRRSRDTTM